MINQRIKRGAALQGKQVLRIAENLEQVEAQVGLLRLVLFFWLRWSTSIAVNTEDTAFGQAWGRVGR